MRPSAAHNWGLTAHMELRGVKYHGERATWTAIAFSCESMHAACRGLHAACRGANAAGCTLHAPFGAASPDLGPRHLMAPAFFRRGLDADVEPLAAVSTANAKLHARTPPGGVAADAL